MSKGVSMIGGLGVGAGLMYLMDADAGRRRRARVRNRMISSLTDTEDAIGKTARDVGNRLVGVVAEVKGLLMPTAPVAEDILIARVRARLGRVVSHPHAVVVHAEHGHIILSGPIMAGERGDAVAAARSVKGVHSVDDQLVSHSDSENVPGLQGEGRRMSRPMTVVPENWSPTGRMLSGLIGGIMAVSGMRRRGLIGTLLGAGGMALLYRAVTNREVRDLVGAGPAHRGIEFHKSIAIHAPVDQVFALWSNPENFPRFMAHLREVRRIDGKRHLWIARGPAGVPAEWESEITQSEPNAIVAWRSVPGSMVENEGIIRFESLPDGMTRADIRLCYHPPAGVLGHAVAALFGTDPKSAMDEDLIRLKSLLEEGKTTAGGHRVTLGEVGAARQGGGQTQSGQGTAPIQTSAKIPIQGQPIGQPQGKIPPQAGGPQPG